MRFSDHSPPLSELAQRARDTAKTESARGDLIKTVDPLESWSFLKFWETVWFGMAEWVPYYQDNPKCFPRYQDWFKALELTPFYKVKVVILGQDPYHTKGMAHGLAFSVQPHIKRLPPSLHNVFKEYSEDLGFPKPSSGDLRAWAERGVLLLNTILTVEEGKPLSHKGLGWEKLCYEVVRALDDRKGVVFLLMGKHAQEYMGAIRNSPAITVPHPSPLAKGFAGTKPFTKVNLELKKLGLDPIDWRLQ